VAVGDFDKRRVSLSSRPSYTEILNRAFLVLIDGRGEKSYRLRRFFIEDERGSLAKPEELLSCGFFGASAANRPLRASSGRKETDSSLFRFEIPCCCERLNSLTTRRKKGFRWLSYSACLKYEGRGSGIERRRSLVAKSEFALFRSTAPFAPPEKAINASHHKSPASLSKPRFRRPATATLGRRASILSAENLHGRVGFDTLRNPPSAAPAKLTKNV